MGGNYGPILQPLSARYSSTSAIAKSMPPSTIVLVVVIYAAGSNLTSTSLFSCSSAFRKRTRRAKEKKSKAGEGR
jgi:hypothetical protein